MLREFELMFIVDGSLSEEDATAVANSVQTFIASKGTILKADAWGRRRMAYLIDKKADGYYWVISYESEPKDVDVIKYNLRVNESVIRWLITRPEHRKTAVQTEAVPEKAAPVAAEVPTEPSPAVEAAAPAPAAAAPETKEAPEA